MFLIDKTIYMRNSRLKVIELMMQDDDKHHGGQAVAGHMPYYWGEDEWVCWIGSHDHTLY